MPLLDHNNLGDERDWGRAFTVLSAITHGYVWQNGGNNPAKVIQKNILIILIHTQTLYTNSNIINITYTDRLL
jgi:hypothetical protein